MSKNTNIYFVSDTGAAVVQEVLTQKVPVHPPWARELLVQRMATNGYLEATYAEFRAKRAWQQRQKRKEADNG